jgi:hypothetical protein
MLAAKAILTSSGQGWGLEFPYVSRFVNVRARTPNIYQTLNAILAFLDVYDYYGDLRALDLAKNGLIFITEGLGCFKRDGQLWFRYWPGCDDPIINVQASMACLLTRLGNILQDHSLLEIANRSVETVLSMQRANGSWAYSADGRAKFVDGFHTGFILQGLAHYLKYTKTNNTHAAREKFNKGFLYFNEHLMTDAGMPLGVADGPISYDGQNFAQCIQTMVICGDGEGDIQKGHTIWENMIKIKQLNLVVQSQNNYRKGYPQLRWTYGPAVLATSYLLSTEMTKEHFFERV